MILTCYSVNNVIPSVMEPRERNVVARADEFAEENVQSALSFALAAGSCGRHCSVRLLLLRSSRLQLYS